MQGQILLVEDTETLSMVYRQALLRHGHEVTCAYSLGDARLALEGVSPNLMLLDLQLPDGDGLELLEEVRDQRPEIRVVVITANGSIYRAVQAMRAGAFDFLVKPFDDARFVNAVHNALATAPDAFPVHTDDPADESGSLPVEIDGFIGRSDEMADIYRMIRSIGRSTATVFITGESGTGKDVCARAIHAHSTRASKTFVPLNCAAIPRDLLESEVFGHLKGSFTGALSDKPGAAAIADGGTLFLDEICEMDLSLQTKLLRFLQTSTIQPVGASRPRSVDVRIVCATNRDPMEEVRAGRFREDLYYRLHVVPIHMPPLRDRPGDVVEIAQSSLCSYVKEEQKHFVGFDDDAIAALKAHPWPGNVRQLLNVVRNVVVLNDGTLVTQKMLPFDMQNDGVRIVSSQEQPESVPRVMAQPAPEESRSTSPLQALVGLPLSEVERDFIEATIEHCGGSIPRASRLLGLSPSTVYRKLESWSNVEKSA
ncbi:MAG: sigma-54 dependent transcriptional regulator [Pseudomonadota bacterium]